MPDKTSDHDVVEDVDEVLEDDESADDVDVEASVELPDADVFACSIPSISVVSLMPNILAACAIGLLASPISSNNDVRESSPESLVNGSIIPNRLLVEFKDEESSPSNAFNNAEDDESPVATSPLNMELEEVAFDMLINCSRKSCVDIP